MPRSAKPRRSALSTVQPDAALPVEEPPAAGSAAVPDEAVGAAVLRVGEYQVGEGFCPHLCGHPDIRY
jgi:hypothetical protein